MGNPTEVPFAQYFKTCPYKRRDVGLQRGKVRLLLGRFAHAQTVSPCTAEQRESIVHINHDANTARDKQFEDGIRTVRLSVCSMAVPDCVHAENEVECVF
jgi:hypothetical protein